MTFPHGQKGHPKNWPLIKRMAQWHVQGVRLADQMRTLDEEGSKYGGRNAFDKFRQQNKTEINAEIQTISNTIKENVEINAEKILKRLWQIQELNGKDRVPALHEIIKMLGLEAPTKSDIKVDAPALTAELGRLLGACIK